MSGHRMIIAIDPGVSGGIAVRSADGSTTAFAMPSTDIDLRDFLADVVREHYRDNLGTPVAVIEDIPKYTGNKIPGSSVFVMARNFGYVCAVCDTLNLEVRLVRPVAWQKAVGAGGKRNFNSTPKWKAHLKQIAQRAFPDLVVTLKTADALLILKSQTGEVL